MKSPSIGYRLKIEMATDGVYLNFKINSWFMLIHETCDVSMPDYCSINQYFGVTHTIYVSDLMIIFDPNSTPVCLLELCHLCRRTITEMRTRQESAARRSSQ